MHCSSCNQRTSSSNKEDNGGREGKTTLLGQLFGLLLLKCQVKPLAKSTLVIGQNRFKCTPFFLTLFPEIHLLKSMLCPKHHLFISQNSIFGHKRDIKGFQVIPIYILDFFKTFEDFMRLLGLV